MALVTCAAMVISLPIPMWAATQRMLAMHSAHSLYWWSSMVVAYLFSAILPVFYFALYRHEGTLRLTKTLRFFSLGGAVCGVIVMAAGWPVTTIRTLLSDCATLACVLLLIALFRATAAADVPVSGLLRAMTKVAVIAGGLWLVLNLLALFVAPGAGAIRTLLEQVCLFTAPLIVYTSIRLPTDLPRSARAY